MYVVIKYFYGLGWEGQSFNSLFLSSCFLSLGVRTFLRALGQSSCNEHGSIGHAAWVVEPGKIAVYQIVSVHLERSIARHFQRRFFLKLGS